MSSYDFRYIGLDSLPSRLSEFDLQQYFQLSRADISALTERFRADHRASAAILLLFLKVAGRPLDRFSVIPRALLRYVGMSLRVSTPTIATMRAIYQRRPTLYTHQAWAKDYLGLKDVDQSTSDELASYLRAHATEVVSIDELVTSARQWLYERQILIPGDRAVRDLARSCYDVIEKNNHAMIVATVPRSALNKCSDAVYASYGGGSLTVLEWLKTPPKRHSPSTLSDTLAKIAFLKTLGAHEWVFAAIPLEKQRGYAQQIQARRPAKSKLIKEPRHDIELVFFLRVTLLELSDSAIYQSGRRVSDLVRRAYDKTQIKQTRNSVSYRERLLSIKALVQDKSKPAQERLDSIDKLLSDFSDKPTSSHAAYVRETLVEDSHRIRSLLSGLENLTLKGRDDDFVLKNLESLREMYAGKISELPIDKEFEVDKPWRELVDDVDRKRAFRALEASTMQGLRRSLRRGSVWIEHSLSYRERDQMLIPPKEWAAERDRHLTILGASASPDEFLNTLLANIDVGLKAVAEAKEQGELTIDEQGLLHLPALEALPEEIQTKRTRDLMFKQIGEVQFPDLILEVDASTNFSEVLLGRRAKNEHELIALYAALIAHGTEIDAKSVAAMTPQLDPANVSSAMRALETPGRLRRASECVVEFQGKHAIAELWGSGKIASSDMMSLDTSKHLWNARVDPRRRTHAAGIYTHVLDKYGIIYDQPIVLNERQAGAAIEGAIRYNDSVERTRLSFLAVDTHGYTNPAMAIAKLSGFDLYPQLRNLSERKLYLPRGHAAPEALDSVLIKEVSLPAIRKGWDELLRLVASIRSGRVSANVALQRFGSAAQGDALHRAADHLGRLLRTLFLCDYFSNPDLRREIHAILNRGESVHLLQRAVYLGKVPTERGRRRDELIAISGSHTLLTNLVLAWNTHHMQDQVERWSKSGNKLEDAWLRRMGPGHFEHINFRGMFRFGVERYAEMLLQPPATIRSAKNG